MRNKKARQLVLKLSGTCLVLLYFSVYQLFAQNILARKISFSYKEKSIEEVIKYLQNYQGVGFSYSKNIINLEHRISGNYVDIELKAILNDIFSETDVIYIYKAGMIILQPKPQNLDNLLITGTLKSIDDGIPIEFAGVQLAGTDKGTITDIKGNFSMIVKKDQLQDTLLVSSLGYERAVFLVSTFTENTEHVVYLKRRIIKLDELRIKASDYKNYKFGNKKRISLGSIYIDTQGQQTALYIKNKKEKKGIISSVSYYLARKGNTHSAFRIRIYDCDTTTDAKPGKDLLKEVVIAQPDKKGGWYKIDLSQFHITAPETGFFVAIEGIYPYNYLQENAGFNNFSEETEEDIPNTISYGQRLGYSNKKGENTWHYSLAHTWFQLKDDNYNVMISAEIQVRKAKD